MKTTIQTFFKWTYHTGACLAFPFMVAAILWFIQGSLFTLSCSVAGMRCEYAFNADRLVAAYAASMMHVEYDDSRVARR